MIMHDLRKDLIIMGVAIAVLLGSGNLSSSDLGFFVFLYVFQIRKIMNSAYYKNARFRIWVVL